VDDGVEGVERFKENVFARLKRRAEPGAADGLLFICQDIFVNRWIGSAVAPLFCVTPREASNKVAAIIEKNYKKLNLHGTMDFVDNIQDPYGELSTSNRYEKKSSVGSNYKPIVEDWASVYSEAVKLECALS